MIMIIYNIYVYVYYIKSYNLLMFSIIILLQKKSYEVHILYDIKVIFNFIKIDNYYIFTSLKYYC